MTDPLTHILFIAVSWAVFVLLPTRLAHRVPAIFGVFFVLIYAPVAAAWIAILAVLASLIFISTRTAERTSKLRKYLPYAILPGFLFVDFHESLLRLRIDTFAISFACIRIFMTLKHLLGSRRPESVGQVVWIFDAAFFLPALIVGPVFSGTDLRRDQAAPEAVSGNLLDVRMILMGFVLASLCSPSLAMLVTSFEERQAALPIMAAAPLLFTQLFFAFWGQSLIAEHTSRFFGYRLPRNFDAPWRAGDIRDFWSRWHRSMARFVMQYIFLPLQINGVSPKLATVAAFVFMGIWHNLSTGYLIWGVAHGLLLAYWPTNKETVVERGIHRVATIAAVVTLSYIANHGSFS